MPRRPSLRRTASSRALRSARARVRARAPLAGTLARTFRKLVVRAALGVAIGIAMASTALALDGVIGWGLPFSAERVRDVVITLTGASLTIAVFALWMRSVVVGLVAGVFHARTLSSFLDDEFQRAITGWMVGAFSVLVTVAVASPPVAHGAAPPLATFLAFGTIVAALLGILVAIRHGAQRLDTSELVHQIADRGLQILDESIEVADDLPPEQPHDAVRDIDSQALGWVRRVDRRAVVDRLPEGGSAELLVTPGAFVAPGQTLLTVNAAIDEADADAMRDAIRIGRARDAHGDLAYSIEELTDVAQHAAGPGADIGTAREALLYLESLLGRVIDRGLPSGHLRVGSRCLRSVAQPQVADHIQRAAERLAATSPADPVTGRLIDQMLERLRDRAETQGDAATVRALDAVRSDGRGHPRTPADDEHRGV